VAKLLEILIDCLLNDCSPFVAPEILNFDLIQGHRVIECEYSQVGLNPGCELLKGFFAVYLQARVLGIGLELEAAVLLELLSVQVVTQQCEIEHFDDVKPNLPLHVEGVLNATEDLDQVRKSRDQGIDVDVLQCVIRHPLRNPSRLALASAVGHTMEAIHLRLFYEDLHWTIIYALDSLVEAGLILVLAARAVFRHTTRVLVGVQVDHLGLRFLNLHSSYKRLVILNLGAELSH